MSNEHKAYYTKFALEEGCIREFDVVSKSKCGEEFFINDVRYEIGDSDHVHYCMEDAVSHAGQMRIEEMKKVGEEYNRLARLKFHSQEGIT